MYIIKSYIHNNNNKLKILSSKHSQSKSFRYFNNFLVVADYSRTGKLLVSMALFAGFVPPVSDTIFLVSGTVFLVSDTVFLLSNTVLPLFVPDTMFLVFVSAPNSGDKQHYFHRYHGLAVVLWALETCIGIFI